MQKAGFYSWVREKIGLKALVLLAFFYSSALWAQGGIQTPSNSIQNSSNTTEDVEAAPKIKTDIFTPTENVFLVVNLPATRLDFYVDNQLKKSYRIAIGAPKYPTPIQMLNISHIVWNPWWIPPPDSEWAKGAEKTPPGPNNPLGPVKMLMEDGIRIHGTNAPSSIGRAASHACLRMKSADAADLAWQIQQRYSSKNDPQLRELYRKKNQSSFWIALGQEVPVFVKYQQVERNGDRVSIHPDRYRKGGFQEELQTALSDRSDILIDKKMIQKLNQKRAKGSFEISLNDLKDIENAFPEPRKSTLPKSTASSPPPSKAPMAKPATTSVQASPQANGIINW